MAFSNPTIAAISTPRGSGGVAMIRISGPGALDIAARVFAPAAGPPISESQERRLRLGSVICRGRVIDTGMLAVFRAPHSYTGEDVAEIYCHGGEYLTALVLQSALEAGAIPAMAGEFTQRAYLNGKLTLTQAEALGLALGARTDAAVLLAAEQSGANAALLGEIEALYERLLSAVSALWACIDYPEEDLDEPSSAKLQVQMDEIARECRRIAGTYDLGRAVCGGVRTTICGRPNAGKSTLMNALCGSARSIVTDIAGTTRDVVEHEARLGAGGSILLKLADTAGLRAVQADDPIEQIGVGLAEERIVEAELLLPVFDGSSGPDGADELTVKLCARSGAPCIAVFTKADLFLRGRDAEDVVPYNGKDHRDEYNALFKQTGLAPAEALALDARDGAAVRDAIGDVLDRLYGNDGTLSLQADAPAARRSAGIVASARQYAALVRCAEALERAVAALAGGMPPDVAAQDAEEAMGALGECCGRVVREDIVGEIFKNFCVGK